MIHPQTYFQPESDEGFACQPSLCSEVSSAHSPSALATPKTQRVFCRRAQDPPEIKERENENTFSNTITVKYTNLCLKSDCRI